VYMYIARMHAVCVLHGDRLSNWPRGVDKRQTAEDFRQPVV